MRVYTEDIPRQIVYVVEAYRLESVLIYVVLVFLSVLALGNRAHLVRVARASQHVRFSVDTYPISKHTAPIVETVAVSNTSSQVAVSGDVVWPIHGIVTTQFGEPHRPWQATHTGIDISSAKPSGVTAVTVFKPGTVIQTNHSGGFGNHVIVDHGGGLTSLYGHLADISVSIGQQVKPGDVLGHEGSTGNSTGTHLHFEVRQNHKPVNPRQFVPGAP